MVDGPSACLFIGEIVKDQQPGFPFRVGKSNFVTGNVGEGSTCLNVSSSWKQGSGIQHDLQDSSPGDLALSSFEQLAGNQTVSSYFKGSSSEQTGTKSWGEAPTALGGKNSNKDFLLLRMFPTEHIVLPYPFDCLRTRTLNRQSPNGEYFHYERSPLWWKYRRRCREEHSELFRDRACPGQSRVLS